MLCARAGGDGKGEGESKRPPHAALIVLLDIIYHLCAP